MFPTQPEDLDSQHVLLILIPRDQVHVAHFVAGEARWADPILYVRYDSASPEAVARGSRDALRGFDPALLRNLITPAHYPAVATVADGVSAAVVAFGSAPPAALTVQDAFFGLAVRGKDEVLLMQGDPDWPPETDDEPWSEPWTPDEDDT